MRGSLGWTLFGINAFCTVVGVTFNAINVKRWHRASLYLYIIMGWAVIFGIKRVVEALAFPGLVLLVSGGVAYTLGIIFYKIRKIRYMHFIWHLFVLAGSILQYFSVLLYCY